MDKKALRNLFFNCAVFICVAVTIATNANAATSYDVSTFLDVRLISLTRLSTIDNVDPVIEITSQFLTDETSSDGTGFASNGTSSVDPDAPFPGIPGAVGDGYTLRSGTMGGASLPAGSADSLVLTNGNISINTLGTADSFLATYSFSWAYTVETVPGDSGEFASAGFDIQANTGGSFGAANIFFEGFGFDFFNTDTNPGLFMDSGTFEASFTVLPNGFFNVIGDSFATGEALAIPIPPAVWLFGSALGCLVWIRRKS